MLFDDVNLHHQRYPGYPGGLNLRQVNATFGQWQHNAGQDGGSLVANPKFIAVNPVAEHDFRMQPDSPAVSKLGFEQVDLRGSAVGPDW
jgi:hypothetical protein